MHATEALREAERLMTVCNSCRYCEGLCAVFPAMELRQSFGEADLTYLANLCHGCGACYHDCQFSPPHEFDVNVPKVMAEIRAETYRIRAWPRVVGDLFERNGLAIALATVLAMAAFVAGFVAMHDPTVLFASHTGPGAFYRLMPHGAMVAVFGAAFLFAVVAMSIGLWTFWRDIARAPGITADGPAVRQATIDAARLTYLDGGGVGCMNADERPTDRRRLYHHLTFYGFLLCLASTGTATLYHYLLGLEAPYPWYDLPVILGTIGGIGLVVGPAGLLAAKVSRDPALQPANRFGGDVAFIAMLFLTGSTGLLLLLFRSTPAMGLLLAVHLGAVLGFFVTMPYSNFVHGLYRYASLMRYARESRLFSGDTSGDP